MAEGEVKTTHLERKKVLRGRVHDVANLKTRRITELRLDMSESPSRALGLCSFQKCHGLAPRHARSSHRLNILRMISND